jgi:ech hydrogenase subunit D
MMRDKQEIIVLEQSALKPKVAELSKQNYRMSQMSCSTLRDGTYEMNYSFEKDYLYTTYRILLVDNKVEIESISDIFFPAFLYENEIHDLFGFTFKGLALDYNGKFYKLSIKTPFAHKAAQGTDGKCEV